MSSFYEIGHLPLISGVLSTLIIFLVVVVAAICAQWKKKNSKTKGTILLLLYSLFSNCFFTLLYIYYISVICHLNIVKQPQLTLKRKNLNSLTKSTIKSKAQKWRFIQSATIPLVIHLLFLSHSFLLLCRERKWSGRNLCWSQSCETTGETTGEKGGARVWPSQVLKVSSTDWTNRRWLFVC